MDAMTMKMDVQYKEMQSCSNHSIPEYDEDDKPMSPEAEVKFLLVDRSFQHHIGIAENMLVEVGNVKYLVDFVILEMKEGSKVPLILRRPFIHTANVVIRVKQKQLNLRVDEILEEDFHALLDERSEILNSIEGTILEEKLFVESMNL
nr:reverse transcriptase domain-containing protein [Tanacetum cinerariifolium]